MSLQDKRIFITGGAGTLGRELIRRIYEKNYNSRITIFSTDTLKHSLIKRLFPEVHCVVGDIREPVTVYNAMAGHDVVIHAAAVKHIPISEENSIDTYQINVEGSINVANAAIHHGVEHVVGISTDKVCHAANAYGATKYLMEKIWQEYSRLPIGTKFHLVRYGNVLESTASVIEIWKNQISRGEPIVVTNPFMTRFWLSPAQAAELVEIAMTLESGDVLIPKMKSLSIQEIMDYTIGIPPYGVTKIPLRPGEKIHETLLTIEETEYATETNNFYILRPTTTQSEYTNIQPFDSNNAPRMTKDELMELLENDIPA